jgi:hypothetical protein
MKKKKCIATTSNILQRWKGLIPHHFVGAHRALKTNPSKTTNAECRGYTNKTCFGVNHQLLPSPALLIKSID